MNRRDLAELEHRTYRVAIDDGIPDIVLGLFLIGVGVAIVTRLWALPATLPLLAVPIWRSLRTTFVEPRIGHVRLLPSRLAKLKRGKFVLKAMAGIALLSIMGIFLLAEGWRELVRSWGVVPLGLVLGLLVAVGGYLFEAKRAYIYALVISLAYLIAEAASAPSATGAFVSGVAVVGSGLVLLNGFIRRYPPQPKGLGGDV